MRAIRITLYTPQPIILPLAYNELVQGMLYSCWRERYPEMHDAGFLGQWGFRPFTFGRLEGRTEVDAKRRTIKLSDVVELEVRSPIEELMDELCMQLCSLQKVRLGAYELQLVNLTSVDRLLFPVRAIARFRTPVVAYERMEDGHTAYLSPIDDGWFDLVQHQSTRRAEALGLDLDTTMQIIPLSETLRKQVTRFKATWVTGWLGDMVVSADPQLLAALWCLGMGTKCSQGFGMFDFVDKPL